MQGWLRWNLREGARCDRRHSPGRGPFSCRDGDPGKALDHPVRLDDLPRTLPEVLEPPWRLDAQNLEAVPKPLEVRVESEGRTAVDSDRLEASVPVQEPAVPDRDAGFVLGDQGTVNPRGGRPGSPPRGFA